MPTTNRRINDGIKEILDAIADEREQHNREQKALIAKVKRLDNHIQNALTKHIYDEAFSINELKMAKEIAMDILYS